MKILRTIISFFLLLFFPMLVKAQIGSAQSQVNLIVNELMSVEVAQSSVMINMNLPSHFRFGNNSGTQSNHVRVTTTSNYTLSVSTTNQYFTLNGLSTSLPVSTIQVEASVGNLNPNVNGGDINVNSSVALNASKVNLLSSVSPETSQAFDVKYVIPTNTVANFLDLPSGNYKTTVIYTIIPQ
ncbi:hypothetical protein [Mesonia aquimarina]|uniref:hypothetical protein n=1 Tax=Mesonia aquimarina TaxID=1504967 RepID=UPI000EF5F37F|nr:hypothetical protein [Mesonia aquimarina]